MENKFYILILTQDSFLKAIIKNSFAEKEGVEFVENVNSKMPVNLIVFDNINKKNLLDKLVKKNPSLIVINTSNEGLQTNCITLQRPFKINELLFVINENIGKNIGVIKLKDCEVDVHKRVALKDGEVLVNLTEKETEIIEYLSKSKKVNKQILLDKVWHYSKLADTKVVESNIYKLRQKFKQYNLKNPILFLDGVYKLSK